MKKRRRAFEAKLDRLVISCFGQTPANILYHYTTWRGFQGIIQSQTLWHTAHNGTNDPGELSRADERIVEMVQGVSSQSTKPIKRMLDGFIHGFSTTKLSKQETLYLACFSEARDEPSEWRDFADGGEGISIGVRRLDEHIVDSHGSNLVRGYHCVFYDEAAWANLLADGFQKVLREFDQYNRINGHDTDWAAATTWTALAKMAAYGAILVKEPGWKDEAEWRSTAFPVFGYDPKPSRYDFGGYEIQYLPLAMRTSPARIALGEVLLGPFCVVSESEVLALLLEAGYQDRELPIIARSSRLD